jgi:hypothetical protein
MIFIEELKILLLKSNYINNFIKILILNNNNNNNIRWNNGNNQLQVKMSQLKVLE